MNWCERCARRCWHWAHCWRGLAKRKCRCPVAARLARARSIFIWWPSKSWALKCKLEAGNVIARAPRIGRLIGGEINFDKVTVTGTENVMMAATLARGLTVFAERGLRTEISDLAELLNKMGARVRGAGTSRIEIEGVENWAAPNTRSFPIGSKRERSSLRLRSPGAISKSETASHCILPP